jgi:predicted CXXCH cytochrome family protein
VRNVARIRYLNQALIILCLFLLTSVAIVNAAITGSKHDFSTKDWGSNEICIFCHTPHNAIKADGTTIYPLWNHKVTTATFTMYSSPSLKISPEPQPRGPSKLCLSCHDGTVAIDSYGNRNGGQLISGPANLGTDLSNDHPISIPWDHRAAGGGNCLSCHVMHGGGELKPNLPLKDGFIECISCHDVHNKYSFGKMVRYTLNRSELCLKCHAK